MRVFDRTFGAVINDVVSVAVYLVANTVLWSIGVSGGQIPLIAAAVLLTTAGGAVLYWFLAKVPTRIEVAPDGAIALVARGGVTRLHASRIRALEATSRVDLGPKCWLYPTEGRRVLLMSASIQRFPEFVRLLLSLNPDITTAKLPRRWTRA
jgi:hypothetical protein